MEIKISDQKPEILERLVEKFGVNWNKGVIITYGDTIYCKFKLPKHKIAHEVVHVQRQLDLGVEHWWDLYFTSVHFRKVEEVLAYEAEMKWCFDNIRNFNELKERIEAIRNDITSSMYGYIMDMKEAEEVFNLGKKWK